MPHNAMSLHGWTHADLRAKCVVCSGQEIGVHQHSLHEDSGSDVMQPKSLLASKNFLGCMPPRCKPTGQHCCSHVCDNVCREQGCYLASWCSCLLSCPCACRDCHRRCGAGDLCQRPGFLAPPAVGSLSPVAGRPFRTPVAPPQTLHTFPGMWVMSFGRQVAERLWVSLGCCWLTMCYPCPNPAVLSPSSTVAAAASHPAAPHCPSPCLPMQPAPPANRATFSSGSADTCIRATPAAEKDRIRDTLLTGASYHVNILLCSSGGERDAGWNH